jgi:hypothetical protein
MRTDAWLPLYLALALVAAGGLAVVLLVPETKDWAAAAAAAAAHARRSRHVQGEQPLEQLPSHRVESHRLHRRTQSLATAPARPFSVLDHRSRSPLMPAPRRRPSSVSVSSTATTITPESLLPYAEPSPSPPPSSSSTPAPVLGALAAAVRNVQLLLLLPGTALAIPLASAQTDILFRLMPVAFGWSLSASSLLVSLRSGVSIVVIGGILPLVKWAHRRRRHHHHQRGGSNETQDFAIDRTLARISSVLLLLGALLTALAFRAGPVVAGVVISSLGAGVPMLCRSLVVGVVYAQEDNDAPRRSPPSDRRQLTNAPSDTEAAISAPATTATTITAAPGPQLGALFGALAVVESLAFIGFTLGFGALFKKGLRGGGAYMGWPFVVAVLVSALTTACLCFLGGPGGNMSDSSSSSGGDSGGSSSSNGGNNGGGSGLVSEEEWVRARARLEQEDDDEEPIRRTATEIPHTIWLVRSGGGGAAAAAAQDPPTAPEEQRLGGAAEGGTLL